jgi:large subunit ribosomal protein L18
LSVFRSHHHISVQIIDDPHHRTLVSATSQAFKKSKSSKTQQATKIGQQIAQAALKKNIKKVKFDRGPYKYHGRIKALAEAARQAGLKF